MHLENPRECVCGVCVCERERENVCIQSKDGSEASGMEQLLTPAPAQRGGLWCETATWLKNMNTDRVDVSRRQRKDQKRNCTQ